MVNQTITCDVCGIQKKEANHWFTFDSDYGVSFYSWSVGLQMESISHACSESCCMTVLSRTLASWSKVPEGEKDES